MYSARTALIPIFIIMYILEFKNSITNKICIK